jgi:exopolyphosphatase/guanosine-5'-triphosphate,3'-diphosphate pyrophosphatase
VPGADVLVDGIDQRPVEIEQHRGDRACHAGRFALPSERPAVVSALFSIGTNSTRLLVLDGDRRVAAESRGTRIGAGIGASGTIDPAARERTLGALDEYVTIVRASAAAAVDAIATSALRRARDGALFAAEVAMRVGIEPRVLSGAEEATYSFLGATASHGGARDSDAVAVLDVGGGSTELAVDVPAHARATASVERTLSLEIGAVRLSERHPALLGGRALATGERRALETEARADAAAILAPFAAERGFAELIAVGGTVFTAAGMLAGGSGADGGTMTGTDRARMIDQLLALDLDARKAIPHIRPQRADILPAGLIVVDEACRLLGIDAFTVSEADLLQGYLTSSAFRAVSLPPKR